MPSLPRLTPLVPVVLALCVVASASPTAGADVDAPPFPVSGAFFGASIGKQIDPDLPECRHPNAVTARTRFEDPECVAGFVYLDREFYLWDGHKATGQMWPTDYARWSRDQGHRLMMSFKPKRLDGARLQWGDIAAGMHDAEIDAHAQRVAAFGAPVYLTFHAEPEYNGAGGRFGTADQYRAAWRRIVQRFRDAGATNATWVLTLMGWTFQGASGRNPFDYYAGSAYVDAVAVDAFNYYDCRGTANTWKSFGKLFQRPYDWIAARGKPMLVGEWGSVEHPDDPDAKARWLRYAGRWIKSHPNLKALTYLSFRDHSPETGRDCDWTVDTTLRSLLAFRELVADPYFTP